MESQNSSRLGAFVNQSSYQFSVRHSDCTKRGALIQCWVPREDGQEKVLSTKGAPFAILGSSDQLALYKYESSKYQPSCDGSNTACAISRVFASVQGALSGDASSSAVNSFNRAEEAQRCGIHSNLLLAVFEEEGEGKEGEDDSSSTDGQPIAVLELAMHEVDVDFTQTCATLREVAQDHGLWIPCLRSARSLDVREEAIAAPSSSGGSLGGSSSAAIKAVGGRLHKPRSGVPKLPCAADLLRAGPNVLRRSSVHVADQEQPLQLAVPGKGPAASLPPQHKQKARGKKADKRPSVIVTEFFGYFQGGARQAAVEAAASAAASSWGKPRSNELCDAPGPLPGVTAWQQQQQQPAGIDSSGLKLHPMPANADAPRSRRMSYDSHGFGRSGGRGLACGKSAGCGAQQKGRQSLDLAADGASLRRPAALAAEPGSSRGSSRSTGVLSQLRSKFGGHKHSSSRAAQQQQQQQQPDIPELLEERDFGSGSAWLQWQQPPRRPAPEAADFHTLAVERSASSCSKLVSPFNSGAPSLAPHHRTLTPPPHPQRHSMEFGHDARLQLQAALSAAVGNAEPHEQQQQQQYAAQQFRDDLQHRDQQVQEEHQQVTRQWEDYQQQQPLQQQQQQQGWQSSARDTASSMTHAASACVSSSVTAGPDARTSSAPLYSLEKTASTASAASHALQGGERVRALVAHGGAFRHTGLGGMWAYVGGAQKLVGVPKHASIAELQGQLAGSPLSIAAQSKIKYVLPVSPRASAAGPTYVDLENDDDVQIMWEEVDDYAATHKGFRLQLYVEAAEAAAAAAGGAGSGISAFSAAASGPFGAAGSSLYASSDSGRGSSGSSSSSDRLLLRGFGQGMMDGSCGMAGEGVQRQGSGMGVEASACNVSARGPGVDMAAGHSQSFMGAGQAAEHHPAPAGASRVLMQQQQQLEPLPEQVVTLVPFYSQQLGSADAAAGPVVGPRRTSSDIVVPGMHLLSEDADQQDHTGENEFLSCTDNVSFSAVAAATGSSRPAAQPAAATAVHEAAPLAATGSYASKCTSGGVTPACTSTMSTMSSTQSGPLGRGSSCGTSMGDLQKQKQQQLKALVEELEGRVEAIMPTDLNIVRYLGGGAFGDVYLCRWHGVEVAVKSLSPSLIAGDSSGNPCADACADLLREAAVLASLHHPNIVSVFGVVLPPSGCCQPLSSRSRPSSIDLAISLQQQQGSAAGSTAEQLAAAAEELTDELLAAAAGTSRPSYQSGAAGSAGNFSDCRAAMASSLGQGHPPAPAIVTEFLSLGSLHVAINNRAEWLRSSMARAKLLLDTARGLDYLHSKRLVHFDLKSANLLVTMRDKVPCVKLADMGLTKQRRQTFVSGINSLRGTLPWMAPEIVKNPETVSEKADIWSFGVCMWQLWTMQEPFEGVHLHALLHQLSAPGGLCLPVPGTPDWQEPECPAEPAPGWAQLMQRCWQRAADERPSARQLVAALEEMMEALRAARRRTSFAVDQPAGQR